MQTVYLTRRNLLTLLAKLDRVKKGEESHCTIIKKDTKHLKYPCSDMIVVAAVEDDEYYTNRNPGPISKEDELSAGEYLQKTVSARMNEQSNFLKIGEVFFHHDLENGWYSLYIDGKIHREYNHYHDLKEDAKTLDISLIWGRDQKPAANYYCPEELRAKLL